MKLEYSNHLDATFQHEQKVSPAPATPIRKVVTTRRDNDFLNKYHKALYGSKRGTLSVEFKLNLRLLVIFVSSWLCCNLFLVLLAFSSELLGPEIFSLMFIGTLVCIFLTFSLYVSISRYSTKIRMKLVFLYGLGISSFILFFDPVLLRHVTGWEAETGFTPGPVLVIMISVFYKKALFDKFSSVLVYALYTQVFYFVLQIAFSSVPLTLVLYEGLTLILINSLALYDSYVQEKSYKECYKQILEEEQNLEISEFSNSDFENRNVNTAIDSIHNLCRKIKLKINDASRGIIFNELKSLLRKTQQEVEMIGKQISNGLYNTNLATVYRSGIDEEDRAFLSEYCNIQTCFETTEVVARRTTKKRAGTATLSIDELEGVLHSLGRNWSFDVWFVNELSGNTILPVAQHLYKRLSLRSEATEAIFTRYFALLEDKYIDNPYHNAAHAADVAHSLLFYLEKGKLLQVVTGIDHLCLIIASLAHDVAHPGYTNRYLINSRHEIALTYNDISVLENMHAATAFQLMKQFNVLEQCKELAKARKLILNMILSTDMFRHFEILSQFNTKAVICNDLDITNETDKILLFSMGLKVADISHTAKYKVLHEKWTALISEEFFLQGDLEKSNGYPVSMYCDRETTNIAKSQAGFIKIICLPLFEAWCGYLKSSEVDSSCLQQLNKNLRAWENQQKTRRKTRIEAFLEPVPGIQKLSSGNF